MTKDRPRQTSGEVESCEGLVGIATAMVYEGGSEPCSGSSKEPKAMQGDRTIEFVATADTGLVVHESCLNSVADSSCDADEQVE